MKAPRIDRTATALDGGSRGEDSRRLARLLALCALGFLAPLSLAQTLGPDFSGSYTVRSLGTAGDVPDRYGAVLFKADDLDTLLIAGSAEGKEAKIYQIKVTRDAQKHINGFVAAAVPFADAPGVPPEQDLDVQGGINAGLDYGPNRVLFYTSSLDGGINQIKAGETAPSRQVRMRSLGIDGYSGGLLFVPAGFPGAGRLKITCFQTSQWYDTTVSPDGAGTFVVAPVAKSVEIAPYALGLAYISAGRPKFPQASVLIVGEERVVSYEVDGNGDPISVTLRPFLSEFPQVNGATVDPVTGDFLFTIADLPSSVVLVGNLTAAPAVVQMVSPPDGSRFTAPATISLVAEASQPGGAIVRVDFYRGNILLLSDTQSPFLSLSDNLGPGEYEFHAVAIDGSGTSVTSASVHVSVVNNGPRITLLTPTNNVTVPSCSDLFISATVQPGNSEIAAVEFFDGTSLLGVSHQPYDFRPYSLTVWLPEEGAHNILVRVTDANGLSAEAMATDIVVLPQPLHTLAVHSAPPDQLIFCFKGQPGSQYVWESTPSLTSPKWVPFLTNTSPASTLRQPIDLNPAVPTTFYRARLAE